MGDRRPGRRRGAASAAQSHDDAREWLGPLVRHERHARAVAREQRRRHRVLRSRHAPAHGRIRTGERGANGPPVDLRRRRGVTRRAIRPGVLEARLAPARTRDRRVRPQGQRGPERIAVPLRRASHALGDRLAAGLPTLRLPGRRQDRRPPDRQRQRLARAAAVAAGRRQRQRRGGGQPRRQAPGVVARGRPAQRQGPEDGLHPDLHRGTRRLGRA